MFQICSVVLRRGNQLPLSDPRRHFVSFAVILVQPLHFDETISSGYGEVLEFSILGFGRRLLLLDVSAIEVAARHQTLAESRQLTNVVVEILYVQL